MTGKENELLNWMADFYKRCSILENDLQKQNMPKYMVKDCKRRYRDLKTEIALKCREVNRIKLSIDFPNDAFLSRCQSNIAECYAWGFTAPSNSIDFVKMFDTVEEGSYKISKFIEEIPGAYDLFMRK